MTMKVPRKKAKGKRARPQTSRTHKLKDVHHSLWKFYWKRSRVLPEETYIEFQSAAARHFHTSEGAISRRLKVLIEHEAVVVVHPRERGASHFWTSQVIRPTEPPDDDAFEAFSVSLHDKVNVDQVVENTEASSTFTFASEAAHSVLTSNDNHIRTTDDKDIGLHTTLSDAELNVDGGCVNTGASLHSKVNVEGARNLGDRIVAAHQKLEGYERAAAASVAKFGNDGGWARSVNTQRGVLARLRQEYAMLKGESR